MAGFREAPRTATVTTTTHGWWCENRALALAGVAQWTECQPATQNVAGANSLLVRMPGLQAGSPFGGEQEATNRCFCLSFFLPSPLSENK